MTFALLALVLTTLFTGAALYITLVEHPVRFTLTDEAMLAQWQPSYARALPIQAGLAIAGGLAGLVACYQTGDWRLMAGSLMLLANWPFTLAVIMPTNKRLKAIAPPAAGSDSRALLTRWGALHAVRSGLGVVATGLVFWSLAL